MVILIFKIVLSIFLILSFFLKLFGVKNPQGLPNGSMGCPLIGETISFLKSHKSNSPGTFLQEHCSRYGKVFKSHLFGRKTIVSCDLELNLFVLQNEGTLFKGSYPKPIHDILGRLSILLVTGALHKKMRGAAVSFINGSKAQPDFLQYVENLSINFIKSWKDKRKMNFLKEAKKFTFYVMLKNLLNMEADDPLSEIILEDFLTFMKGFVSLPLYIPGTYYTKAVKARMRITSTLKEMILKRREKIMKSNSSDEPEDFLDELMAKDNLNDSERVSLLLDLLLAGYETTSGLMTLIVYFLGKTPNALRSLKEEHEVLQRRKKGEAITWEDYKKMQFTSHVINEAMRCGNLVKFVHREAIQDVNFKGYLIPAGWQVLPVMAATHLDPYLHENPSEFNPSRWNDPTTIRKVTPFGGGLRICPGADLGKLEIALFLHHFVLNLRWKTTEEDAPILCPFLDFKKGLPLEMEPISS